VATALAQHPFGPGLVEVLEDDWFGHAPRPYRRSGQDSGTTTA
jgi:hypothetical protein